MLFAIIESFQIPMIASFETYVPALLLPPKSYH
jgi:hypothetical protein